MKFTTALTLLLFTASTMAAEQSVRGAAVVAIDANDVDASFWSWMYNALKCPPGPLGKHCHSGGGGGSGGSSSGSSSGSGGSSSGGSGGGSGTAYPCTGTSNDGGGCADDDGGVQYPVGTSNDSGSSVTPSNGSGGVFSYVGGSSSGSQSAMAAMVGVALVAVAVVAAVILRKKRAGAANADKKTALIDVEMSPTGEPKEGLVSSRLKSFNDFMRSRAADPVEQGFEADNQESSKIDFIECKN